MAEPSLDGCFAKCSRAQEHLELFKAEAQLYGAARPYRITGKFQRQTGDYVFRVMLPPSPPRLGVVLGDVVHNLRSALDHLAWQLVRANGSQPFDRPGGNAFPIRATCPQGGFRAAMARGPLIGASNDAIAEIGRLQPYRRGNGGKRNLLCVLNRLWNADKHRIPHALRAEVLTNVADLDFKPNRDAGQILVREIRGGAKKDGAEIARVKLAPIGRDPKVEMDMEIVTTVTLDDGSPAIENLYGMATHVLQAIRQFKRFFW